MPFLAKVNFDIRLKSSSFPFLVHLFGICLSSIHDTNVLEDQRADNPAWWKSKRDIPYPQVLG